jgi:hypothetical protein
MFLGKGCSSEPNSWRLKSSRVEKFKGSGVEIVEKNKKKVLDRL